MVPDRVDHLEILPLLDYRGMCCPCGLRQDRQKIVGKRRKDREKEAKAKYVWDLCSFMLTVGLDKVFIG